MESLKDGRNKTSHFYTLRFYISNKMEVKKMGIEQEYGLTPEEAKKTKDITPTYNMGDLKVGQTAHFRILSDKPDLVEVLDKQESSKQGKEIKTKQRVLKAYDKATGMEVTIWLSSKSLSMGFLNIARNNNNSLLDVDVVVSVRVYEHPMYGKTRAYGVQLDRQPE